MYGLMFRKVSLTLSRSSLRLHSARVHKVTSHHPLCSSHGRHHSSLTMTKIGTHNGTFHCDEVLACYLLRLLPEYKDAEIVRTRDPAVLETCDIVVDVGAVYDPAKHRYDHHQRSFSDSMSSLRPGVYPWTTKLSSAGLIYYHFGERVLASVLSAGEQDKLTQTLYSKIYQTFIEEVDGIDNGINPTDEKPRYTINSNLSSRVGHLNPRWNEEATDADVQERFNKAIDLVGAEFMDRVSYYRDGWWPARTLVEQAIESRFETDASGEVIKFASGGCPWKDHLFNLEELSEITPAIKFALYPDQSNNWRVQCVPKERNTFENRYCKPVIELGSHNEDKPSVTNEFSTNHDFSELLKKATEESTPSETIHRALHHHHSPSVGCSTHQIRAQPDIVYQMPLSHSESKVTDRHNLQDVVCKEDLSEMAINSVVDIGVVSVNNGKYQVQVKQEAIEVFDNIDDNLNDTMDMDTMDIGSSHSRTISRQRQSYTHSFKLDALNTLDELGGNVSATSRKHGVSRAHIWRWRAQRQQLLNTSAEDAKSSTKCRMKVRKAAFPLLEEVILQWLEESQQQGIKITLHSVQEKAKKLFPHFYPDSEFKASDGWARKFLLRHNKSTKYE